MKLMKVWIEADRIMPYWMMKYLPRDWERYHEDEGYDEIILEHMMGHNEVQGFKFLNYLLKRGCELISTHDVTTGGVCVGTFALVDISKIAEPEKRDDVFVVQFYDKEDLSEILDREISDYEFKRIKDTWMPPDTISQMVEDHCNYVAPDMDAVDMMDDEQ